MTKSEKISIIAPAIKVNLWNDFYESLKDCTHPLHVVFVGHVKPDFKLPLNFSYVYCPIKSGSFCAQLGFEYVCKYHSDSKFIFNTADDSFISGKQLEDLVHFYNDMENEYNTELLMAGPLYYVNNQPAMMSYTNGGPCLLGPYLCTLKTRKKIGGIDRKFRHIHWDNDLHLRLHEMGGIVIHSPEESGLIVNEVDTAHTLSKGNYSHDYNKLLKSLWKLKDDKNSTIVCSRRDRRKKPQNVAFIGHYKVTRLSKVEEYGRDEFLPYL